MARKGMNIYKRKDGRWEGRYIKGRGPDGNYSYGSVYGQRYAEVKMKLIPLKAQYDVRGKIAGAKFDGQLFDWMTYWLQDVIKPKVKPSTYAGYLNKIQNHILPALGGKKLEKLSTEEVQKFVYSLADKGLSPNSTRAVFRILSAAMNSAADSKIIILNPCGGVALPKAQKTKVQALSLEQQKILEQAALRDKNGAVVILALYTGMRIGELCALMWDDVDLKNGIIHVRRTMERISADGDTEAKTQITFGTPKTESSCRIIPLCKHLIAYLKERKAESESKFVASCKNSFVEPRAVRYRLKRLLEASGLPRIRFHSLRHTFATRCIERNIDVTTLSKLLGHNSVKLTLDVYTDSMLEQRRRAMYIIDNLFSGKSPDGAARFDETEDGADVFEYSGEAS